MGQCGRDRRPQDAGITLAILADIGAMLKISPELTVDLPVPFYYMRSGKFVREEI